jgi:hypothetical protein
MAIAGSLLAIMIAVAAPPGACRFGEGRPGERDYEETHGW